MVWVLPATNKRCQKPPKRGCHFDQWSWDGHPRFQLTVVVRVLQPCYTPSRVFRALSLNFRNPGRTFMLIAKEVSPKINRF